MHEKALGTHWLRVEEDSLFLTLRGALTADDLRTLFEIAVHIKQKHNVVFFFYDGRQCTGMDANARKVLPKKELDDGGAILRVVFGIPFGLRVILNMVTHAQKALFKRDVRIHVFEHENEAREFFTQECQNLRKIHSRRAEDAVPPR